MIKALRTFDVTPVLPDALQPLLALAMNLRWAWHAPTRALFAELDAQRWQDVGGNPVALLHGLSTARFNELAQDATVTQAVVQAHEDLQQYLTEPRWAQQQDPAPPMVAYFSPEFGITEVMQTYSGGLGILAGDHLKAASDLGMHMVAVGLLYRHGYFRQWLDGDGQQQERYPDLDPRDLPLQRLEHNGQPLLVEVPMADEVALAHVWLAQVGRVPLLLLDTDVEGNSPAARQITDKLYGGDVEHRLRQELVLGIGGVRAVYAAVAAGHVQGEPQLWHSNEGHAGFLQVERLRRLVEQHSFDFAHAVESARAAVLFTTHTPVPAGIDVFPRPLMERYFADVVKTLGIDMDEFMTVGQGDGEPPDAPFNMAFMGLRLSATANGVSLLHGQVSRAMFAQLWPGIGADDVPISSVTNGVHASTWVGEPFAQLFAQKLGPAWATDSQLWQEIDTISDHDLWQARQQARARAIRAVQDRDGGSAATLDPDVLTIGFARRFAEYKRGTMLLRHPERLLALLQSNERPVQFIFAGKAHPRDELGKELIRTLVQFGAQGQVPGVVFVEDYDIGLARQLVAGVDVWLNTPRRPHEACGTSGMKAVLNGGVHCSTLDGWWDELYDGQNGFAIGGHAHDSNDEHQDARDARALFEVLEREVVPTFYARDDNGLPGEWLALMRRSLRSLGPQVLAARMVREYSEVLYTPLAARATQLALHDHARARSLADWKQHLRTAWPQLTILQVDSSTAAGRVGAQEQITVRIALGEVAAHDIHVEVVHGALADTETLARPEVNRLALVHVDEDGVAEYHGQYEPGQAGAYGMTVRAVAHHPDLRSWADAGLVTWATGDEGRT